MTSQALDHPPPVTNCHTTRTPSPPSSVTYFMGGPLVQQRVHVGGKGQGGLPQASSSLFHFVFAEVVYGRLFSHRP